MSLSVRDQRALSETWPLFPWANTESAPLTNLDAQSHGNSIAHKNKPRTSGASWHRNYYRASYPKFRPLVSRAWWLTKLLPRRQWHWSPYHRILPPIFENEGQPFDRCQHPATVTPADEQAPSRRPQAPGLCGEGSPACPARVVPRGCPGTPTGPTWRPSVKTEDMDKDE